MNDQRTLYLDAYSRRTSWKPAATRLDGRLLALAAVLLLLVTTAGLLYLSQASAAAQMRYRLLDSERQQDELQERIAVLRCQVAAGESLASLERRVARLGLADAPADAPIVVCYVPAPPAPAVVTAPADQAAPGPGMGGIGHLLSLLALKLGDLQASIP